MTTRREFLSQVSQGAALALAPGLPTVLEEAALGKDRPANDRVLVVIELTGGNDGLNTVVPLADDVYHRSRPTLRVKPQEALKLNDRVGLHPKMAEFRKLFDQGELAIVQNVGYPNPVRSHSRSMEIWQSGQLGPAPPVGWLGRAAEADPRLHSCFIGDGPIPLAVRQRGAVPFALSQSDVLSLRPGAVLRAEVPPDADPLVADVARRMAVAQRAAKAFGRIGGIPPLDPAAIGQWIKTGMVLLDILSPPGVLYVPIPGFDTHQSQAGQHGYLLGGISKALGGAMDLIRVTPLADRVLILIFSEFGRRLAENASGGTDHGAGAPVFLLGKRVRGGLYGTPPDLKDLDEAGDPKFSTDFRDVYAALLGNWLGVAPEPILPGRHPLPLVKI